MRLSHTLARTSAAFDDPNLVSHAGLVPVMALAEQAGLHELAAELVRPGDCTRIRVLRTCGQLNQKTAIQFADYLPGKLPFRVEAIQTDNGSEFQTAFHWHLTDRGIRHIYIKHATPRLNGKAGRSHRIDAEESCCQLKGVLIDDAQLFNDKLKVSGLRGQAQIHVWAFTASAIRDTGCAYHRWIEM